jgi:Methyltransferase domain
MRYIGDLVLRLADPVVALVGIPAALTMKIIRRVGTYRLPLTKKMLLSVGVFPIRRHYYEPLFDPRELKSDLDNKRVLPGVEFNESGQLELLAQFCYSDEIPRLPVSDDPDLRWTLSNTVFGGQDALYYYNFIRLKKPKMIIEIGSGYSTLVASSALQKNRADDPGYVCELICVEPYESPWLEKTEAVVIRSRVETLDPGLFSKLGDNDLLFIDSSHVIRPQGDVTFEYLQILPTLKSGVVVHIHDVFTPRDYPKRWVVDMVYFWNEQYLLEALLSENPNWKIIGALNALHHDRPEALAEKCPLSEDYTEPASIYIQRV